MTDQKTEYKLSEKKTCPYCQSQIKAESETIYCNFCGTPHHTECWNENAGCTTYGCRNNHITEKKTERESDIGNRTIDEIKSIVNEKKIEDSEKNLECYNCNNSIDINSIYCKYCGAKLDEKNKSDFSELEAEFQRKSKDNLKLKKRTMYLTYSSIGILSILLVMVFYFSYKIIDNRINSDGTKIKNLINKWNEAFKKKEPDKIKPLYEKDFIYYDKNGNENTFDKRFKQLSSIMKNEKYKNTFVSDFKLKPDSTSVYYYFITFNQNFYYEKGTKSESKYFKLYKDSTTGKWTIFREYFDLY